MVIQGSYVQVERIVGTGELMTDQRAIPISFVIVVPMIIALFIFFGAWAVSVDASNHNRELTFAIGNRAVNEGLRFSSEASLQPTTESSENIEIAADTWWGQSLLYACPLH